ncbi:hypothetical protein StrepF001_27450 [Streptomyces sp. F001]|nr:hypothetical protein StrepF001_27450 [Streptomyces sp. F001]
MGRGLAVASAHARLTASPGAASGAVVVGIVDVVVLVVRLVGLRRPYHRDDVRAHVRPYDGVHDRLLRVRAKLFRWRAAPRTGEGAIQVPSARVAVVHDAGRLSSAWVTFIGSAVNVLW